MLVDTAQNNKYTRGSELKVLGFRVIQGLGRVPLEAMSHSLQHSRAAPNPVDPKLRRANQIQLI